MRLLHTMIRVGDLDKSIAFYTEALGMKLLRKHDYPEGKFTLAFLGYGDEDTNSVIELTQATILEAVSATSPSARPTSSAPANGCVSTAGR